MKTLYIDAQQKRFFYVPDDAVCPKGDYRVMSILGKELATDSLVLDVYEISEEEAKEITREGIYSLGRRLRDFAGTTASLVAKQTEKKDPVQSPDPNTVGDAFQQFVKGVVAATRETVQNPDQARERAKDFAEALKERGLSPEDAAVVETIPEKLRAVLEDKDTLQGIEEATQRLKQATETLIASVARKD